MKWTNRGHELDLTGESLIKVETLYVWGAGKFGRECLEFLNWLAEFKSLEIVIIDSNPEKQGANFEKKPVISPESFFERYNADCSPVVITPLDNTSIVDSLIERGIENYYFWQSHYSSKRNFIQHFVNIWLYYRHGKLMHQWGEFIVTNKCNLNCIGCLNFTSSITQFWSVSFEAFKKHIDIVFSKYDYLFSFHFSGGEPTLNKDLDKMIDYICKRYKSRIYKDIFFITNGTLNLPQNLIDTIKANGVIVHIDDYTENVPLAKEKFPKLVETLKQSEIMHSIQRTDKWFDVDIQNADYSNLPEESLIRHRDECNTMYQTFNNGNIYSCCYAEYAKNSNAIEADESNVLSIEKASKSELLEFGMGFTTTGYVDLCKHCHGIGGKEVRIIPCAVQAKGREWDESDFHIIVI